LNTVADTVVVNFAGEGELDDAININSLVLSRLTKEAIARRGPLIIGDIRSVPIKSSCTDRVFGRNVPFLSTDDWAGQVSREAFRILKPRGIVQICSEAGGAVGWLRWLRLAGFDNVVEHNGYAVGIKR
jgi:hypothetical protein